MRTTLVALLSLSLVAGVEAARIKARAEPDPTFDFATIRTWTWDDEAGDVRMARTPMDDPAALKQRIDPLIRKYVGEAMAKKGLTLASSGEADMHFHYYVLVTLDTTGQTMGQFLPAVPYWGLPPFTPATTALSVVTRGALVLDAMPPGKVGDRRVIWRGIAQSTVEDADSDAVRTARIRDACDELIKRFPLKKKK